MRALQKHSGLSHGAAGQRAPDAAFRGRPCCAAECRFLGIEGSEINPLSVSVWRAGLTLRGDRRDARRDVCGACAPCCQACSYQAKDKNYTKTRVCPYGVVEGENAGCRARRLGMWDPTAPRAWERGSDPRRWAGDGETDLWSAAGSGPRPRQSPWGPLGPPPPAPPASLGLAFLFHKTKRLNYITVFLVVIVLMWPRATCFLI